MYSVNPTKRPRSSPASPDEPALTSLLRYLSGPLQAHEETAWAQLARVIFAECSNPWDDAEVRQTLQARGRATHVVRTAPTFLRPAVLRSVGAPR